MDQNKLKQRVANMDNDQMRQTIRELVDTKFYPAILKYITQRLETLNNVVWSVDPSKNPEKVTQAQGLRAGLLDLSNFAEMSIDQKVIEENDDINSYEDLSEEQISNGTAAQIINSLVHTKPNSVVNKKE